MIQNNFVLTTLAQNPEYFEEVIDLIEEGFHYNESFHYEKDFAPLVDPLNFENCFIYIDKETNELAAHLAVCLRTLIKDQIEMQVALIGGIVTSKKHRGKKLFENLMNHALKAYENKVSLYVLWSDLEVIYEKFLFYRTAGIIETGKGILSSREKPAGYEKINFPSLSEKEFDRIRFLYQSFNEKYFFTLKREDKDWAIIRNMSSIDLYIKKNQQGEIVKYFCINKGRDLANIIHEISCLNPTEYLKMLKDLSGYKLWLPETEQININSVEVFYTAFMKIGNRELLNNFLHEISDNKLTIKKIDGQFINFVFNEKTYDASCKDFLQYLFGPKPLEEFSPYNLSPYFTGTDSV